MISCRRARANNPQLGPTNYDPQRPTSYITYLDANNLYGWAMSQSMPHSQFKWLDETEFSTIDWRAQTSTQDDGYFIECDLEYPKELHELHNDYPLAAERLQITHNMLSEKQVEIERAYAMTRGAGGTKLVPNLMDKSKYCLHYQNLKFYLEQGLVLKKVCFFFSNPVLFINLYQNAYGNFITCNSEYNFLYLLQF